MEPIPEEENDLAELSITANDVNTIKNEHKTRLTEVYTSEQVDTLVSTMPESAVPHTWDIGKLDPRADPSVSPTYITEAFAGPASSRGSQYSYSYETRYDDQLIDGENCDERLHEYQKTNGDVERKSVQTQKITKVTKVTTTRSIRQIPVENFDNAEIYFDSEGSPYPVSKASTSCYEHSVKHPKNSCKVSKSDNLVDENEANSNQDPLDIPPPPPAPLSKYCSRGATPIQADELYSPGILHVFNLGSGEVEISWEPAEKDDQSSDVIDGYQIEVRQVGSLRWRVIEEKSFHETRCRVSGLDTMMEYEFRVSAINSNGLCHPSLSSAAVKFNSTPKNQKWPGTTPGKPCITSMDRDRVLIEWDPAVIDSSFTSIAGYEVEYRAAESVDWIQSNNFLVSDCTYEVQNLRPYGEYEFRVLARSADGLSQYSLSSGIIRIRPSVPSRNISSNVRTDIIPPGQPQVIELDIDWVKLHWSEAISSDNSFLSYIIEFREIGDPLWYTAVSDFTNNTFTVERLRPNSTYEFRIIARCSDGSVSKPSIVSDVIQLRPNVKSGLTPIVPCKPQPPEYVDFDGGDRVTLCWYPAVSSMPISGYEVEFRDYQQDTAWYKVNEILIQSCKMTIGDLINGHEYQFRVIASNAIGYSEPSDPSFPIRINCATNGDLRYVDRESLTGVHNDIPLLQDEIIRESPPLPDRDDSPPPINRSYVRGKDQLHWRDPTLKEVIEYLDSHNKVEQLNASGYLQHLTYNDNAIKEETRELNGVPKLVRLLNSDVAEIQRNVCGCLKNLSYGKENDVNKRAISAAGGIEALSALLRQTSDLHIYEEVTAVLWNLSSCDELKAKILDQSTDAIVQQIIVPVLSHYNDSDTARSFNASVFRNATGVLRNTSATSPTSRKTLRSCPSLIESLLNYLNRAVLKNQVDSRCVENVVCILRNLSYRIQEVEDPNYDPRKYEVTRSGRERSRSAPSGSPRNKKKESKKKRGKNDRTTCTITPMGPRILWQPELVRLYLKLLQESSNSETLEASAGAIHNLAACHFEPSVEVRTAVRTEKGLPILVELLRLNDDKVVCAVTTALRNLSLDPRNRELIGKYAMKDLVAKLPKPDRQGRDTLTSGSTVGAVLGILFEMIKYSSDFTRSIHECGGTDRLRLLARSHPLYSARVCKYATQVLYMMWQHKDLHDGFRRAGLKEADFYSGSTSKARDTATLARPISSQGAERPVHLRSENFDDSASAYARYDEYTPRLIHGSSDSPRSFNHDLSSFGDSSIRYHSPTSYQPPSEALYASVQKRSNSRRQSVGGDSWV